MPAKRSDNSHSISEPALDRDAGRFRVRALAIGLVIVTLLAYLPVLRAGFVWDDEMYVVNNVHLRSLGGLLKIWFTLDATPQYYPMVFTTFWIEHHLWGNHAAGYHLINVLLHGCNATLLFFLLRRLGFAIGAAWLVAAIFALHPVHVESVAWIAERKNVLSGLLYLSAFLAYLRFINLARSSKVLLEDDVHPRRWAFYVASIAAFAGALFSKTVTASLPAAILLVLWWKRGRLRWNDVLPLLPMFALGAVMGMITAKVEREHVGASGPEWDFSIADRTLIAGRAVWHYAHTLVWPSNLTFIYPRWQIDPNMWLQWAFPGAAALLLALLWALHKRFGRGPLVAALFFGGTLFPALGFVNVYPFLFSFVADHFQYLASIGLISLLAAVAWRMTATWPHMIRNALAASVLMTLGGLTWKQTLMYADAETLWTTTLQRNPGAWMAHDNLSALRLNQGQFTAAANHAQQSLAIRSPNETAYNNLGLALESLGRPQEAIAKYELALKTAPLHVQARLNLASLLFRTNDFAGAERHYSIAVMNSPEFAPAHYNFAVLLATNGDINRALQHATRARELEPGDADIRALLGFLYAQQGHDQEALREINEALRLNPNHERARSILQMLKN